MLDSVLKAIVEPRRRDILRLVHNQELTSGQIASHFDVTRPAISQHLQVLKEAGLVTVRQQGTRRLYRTRPEGMSHLQVFLQEFWDVRLNWLKEAAEAEERRVLDSGDA